MVFADRSLDEILMELNNPYPIMNYNIRGETEIELMNQVIDVSLQNRALVEIVVSHIASGQYLTEAVQEAFINAYWWSNRKDSSKQIFYTEYLADNGYLILVSTLKGGFDYREKIRKFQEGLPYSDKNTGGGFRWYNQEGLEVSFCNEGKTTMIMVINREESILASAAE